MSDFVGRFEHSLDEKGRLSLPARFRLDFADGANLTQHFEGCLALWAPGEFSRQMRDMKELYRQGNPDARNQSRMWAQGVSVLEVDKQGRLVVPASARTFAGLSSEALIIGVLDHLEIWNPRRFDERVAPAEGFLMGSDLA